MKTRTLQITAILILAAISAMAMPPMGPPTENDDPGMPRHAPMQAYARDGQNKSGRHGHQGSGGGMPAPKPEVLIEAGATAEQVEALETLEYETSLRQIDLQAAVKKAELTLNNTLRATDVKDAVVLKAVDTLNEARGNEFKAQIERRLKVRQLLGDDVIAALHDAKPKRPSLGRGAEQNGDQRMAPRR